MLVPPVVSVTFTLDVVGKYVRLIFGVTKET